MPTKKYTESEIASLIADTRATIDKANELVTSRANDGLNQTQIDRLEKFDRENGLGDHSRFCIATDEARGTQSVGISVAEARRRGMRIDKILKGSR
jgi:hypothetical protein